jgi:hypothetical protein
MTDAGELFAQAVAALGPVELARRLGYRNHTLVSRIACGAIAPNPKFWARVEAVLGRIACPVAGREISRDDCAARRAQAAPTHHPSMMQAWKTCRACAAALNPANEGKTPATGVSR